METVKELGGYVLDAHASVRECVETINNNKDNIALILGSERELIGTVTDGDVRRYLLKGGALDDSCRNVVWENPVTANLNDKENPYGLTEFDIEEIDELLNAENEATE